MFDNFDKLDLEQILEPIGSNKVGENVKFTAEYSLIKKNINKKQIVYGDNDEKNVQVVDWVEIFSISFDILATKSKDLSVLFYVLISSEYVYSCKNTLDNIYIIGKFIDTFYESFFPQKKAERENFINWFFKKIISDLKNKQIIVSNHINTSEYDNTIFLQESCIYLQSVFKKYNFISEYFNDFCDIVSDSIGQIKERVKVKNYDKSEESFTDKNSLNAKKISYDDVLKLEVFDTDSAYDAINKIQKYIEKQHPRCIAPLLIDILNKFKDYETTDLIRTQEEDSPLKLIAKLINFI